MATVLDKKNLISLMEANNVVFNRQIGELHHVQHIIAFKQWIVHIICMTINRATFIFMIVDYFFPVGHNP